MHLDHAQADPYASPSRARVQVGAAAAGFAPELFSTPARARALCDWLARAFGARVAGQRLDVRSDGGGSWHGAKGGEVHMDAPAQHVLERTAVVLRRGPGGALEAVEARFTVALPAQGRSVLGRWAWDILGVAVPQLAQETLVAAKHDPAGLLAHCLSVENQHELRQSLRAHGLVAFVRDGAVLPRESGASDRPLGTAAVPFASPDELRVELPLHNGGAVTGMGIKAGVTLIVGGGFHGKSTLLAALKAGCYDHVPGDGREFVAVDPAAMAIRAEDGRCVGDADVSSFIANLPQGKDTRRFSTADASGSTSQAAATVEAVEAGARCLLLDEDTCATNFMVRLRARRCAARG